MYNRVFNFSFFALIWICLSCSANSQPDQQKESTESQTWAEKLGFPAGKKILIFHADDIGMCMEANISASRYLEQDEIQSAAVMMPCRMQKLLLNGLWKILRKMWGCISP